MTRGQKGALAVAALIVLAIVAGIAITLPSRPTPIVAVTGAVLRQDADPRRQMPIDNADITASGLATAECKSDSSGFFRLTLPLGLKPALPITLTFRHAGYQPLEITQPVTKQIFVARLVPIQSGTPVESSARQVVIANVRLRYSTKATTTVSVGSMARTFEVVNTGDVPCNGHAPCSPDGKWKAATASSSLDAGPGNEFVDARASCIAGPCPFTRIESDEPSNGGRTVKVVALNWSDTATFLVEAQVTHTTMSDIIRQAYPVIFGNGMNFTLPAAAEGPSVEADLDGSDIVFPLGPDLLLSWATCTVKIDADRSKLYGCELKPGYRFQ